MKIADYSESTHHGLVAGEHLAQAEHQHHEAHEPQQGVTHGPPVHRTRRRVNPVPDVHVEVIVELQHKQEESQNKIYATQ